mmetsp:Transcript_31124/g.51400  ORF Transcript_31124/g.51400 Transcript_31124/m.51400 type:complete len:234 (+) Transcript_31124:102-803(+)|eukprot:CAMPEP_0119013854 /NCGR_PEP_ID=MMETSP1176-20130426/9099_1 /TAXON_ID=265551 /ORGANISM="Synedropsis recta cf, Strain CCMP1620" /LENGTH=233 /DNA_ID=CAMNT_0006966975 /DNA_START=73 /DNA_END=774 /DNA_ORIENTATION=-
MSIITGTVYKQEADSKVGISFSRRTKDAPLTVASVRDGGLFSSTSIVPGLLVLTVDGVDVTGKSPKEAAGLLGEAGVGEVTVVTTGIVATATKRKPDALCGVVMKQKGDSPILTVSRLTDESLFASSDLVPGLVIAAINGIKTPPTAKDAAKLLKDAKDDVSIVAWDPAWAVVPEPEPEPIVEEAAPAPVEEEYVEVEAPKELERKMEEAEEKKEAEESTSFVDNLCGNMCNA